MTVSCDTRTSLNDQSAQFDGQRVGGGLVKGLRVMNPATVHAVAKAHAPPNRCRCSWRLILAHLEQCMTNVPQSADDLQ